MADVFISYANEDRARAQDLAFALEEYGWSIWWDRSIVAGETFDDVIERELNSAKSVVVLWSRASILSEWVRNEAAEAAKRGVLVPAAIDGVSPPLEFRRKQTVNLAGWDGNPAYKPFVTLRTALATPNRCRRATTPAGDTASNSISKNWLESPPHYQFHNSSGFVHSGRGFLASCLEKV